MRDSLLKKLMDALEEAGCRVMSEDELAEATKLTPEEGRRREMDASTLLQIEHRESDGDLAWRPGMEEISGLGGSYELACRVMLRAGIRWLREHPTADPRFRGYTGVFYSVLGEDNADARALSEAVVAAASDCTGAMHQATVRAALYVKEHGWESYCDEMSSTEGDEEGQNGKETEPCKS